MAVKLDPWQLIKEVGWNSGGYLFIVTKSFLPLDTTLAFCSIKFMDPADTIQQDTDPPGDYTPTMHGLNKRHTFGTEWTEVAGHYWDGRLPFAEGGANPLAQIPTTYPEKAMLNVGYVDTEITHDPDSRAATRYTIINFSKIKELYGHDQSKLNCTLGVFPQHGPQANTWGDLRFEMQAFYYPGSTKFVYEIGGYYAPGPPYQKIWRAEEGNSPLPATPLAVSGCLHWVTPGPHTQDNGAWESTPTYELTIGAGGSFLSWSGGDGSGCWSE